MKTCCIISQPAQTLPFGYNEEENRCIQLKEALRSEAVHLLTAHGVTHFQSNLSYGAPLFAAELLQALKTVFPDLTTECVLPHELQAEKWSEAIRDRYFTAAEHCDKETLLQTKYTEDCEQACDRYMIDRADVVLAVFDCEDHAALQYARTQGKKVVLLKP